ncbi:cytochrome c oxidase subunit 5b-2, mitochondrial-like [Pistacia vera]|uniref:cytochrome c oxidase subunit 5b-2, mitochondrial-like n=1 Tax=Pistacia vera TaxID=55513 RepID=UPI001263DB1B|nr:cytochrome c oxidase subunit 5b-2, mitochondrial-like [Pistacia vera]
MWGRSTKLVTLTSLWRSSTLNLRRSLNSAPSTSSYSSTTPFLATPTFSSHQLTASSVDINLRKKVEDIMPIATGHELEELDAELQGRNVLEINHPVGPFGTKEAPAIVKSVYDKRIVGCPGGEGEDEHDVVWFWLEKGKPHECPVCSQHFKLEVDGSGGPPGGH